MHELSTSLRVLNTENYDSFLSHLYYFCLDLITNEQPYTGAIDQGKSHMGGVFVNITIQKSVMWTVDYVQSLETAVCF